MRAKLMGQLSELVNRWLQGTAVRCETIQILDHDIDIIYFK